VENTLIIYHKTVYQFKS